MKQTVGSTVTNYLWDEGSSYGDVINEYNNSGSTLASYVLGGTGLISQTRGATTSYFLQDGQGSTRALTSSTGTVTDTYSYTAFGEQFSSSGTTVNSYRYTGQQFDSLASLYSLRARYYNPALGRFLSQDRYPINFNNPVELNRYVYTGNDPINRMDPSGHLFVEYVVNTAKSIKNVAVTYGIGAAATYTYLLALNTPWVVTGMLLVGGTVEGYLLYRALFFGDQDAAFALATGYQLTGYSYSTLVDLASRVWGAARTSLLLGRTQSQSIELSVAADDISGWMSANEIRYTQDSVNPAGNIWKDGQVVGKYTLEENVQQLKMDPNFDLPPIRIFRMKNYMLSWPQMQNPTNASYPIGDPKNLRVDQIYSLDNRRLLTYRLAERSTIPVRWATENEIMENIHEFTTKDFGLTIETLPWINP